MKAPSLIDRFLVLRSDEHGNPHGLRDDRLRVLWTLNVTKDDADLGYLTAAQVSEILCDAEGIHVPRQKVSGMLEKERGTVTRKRRGNKTHYKVMKLGADEISPSLSSTYIDPEKALSQI